MKEKTIYLVVETLNGLSYVASAFEKLQDAENEIIEERKYTKKTEFSIKTATYYYND